MSGPDVCPQCEQRYDQRYEAGFAFVPVQGCSRCGTVALPDRVIPLTLEGEELAYAAMEWLDGAKARLPHKERKKVN